MAKTTQMAEKKLGDGSTVSGWLLGAGLMAAIAGFTGASCCVVPLILAAFGVGGAWIAQLAIFVTYQTYIAVGAVILVAIGWLLAIVRGASRRAKFILALSTLLIAAAFVVPLSEEEITQSLLSVLRG